MPVESLEPGLLLCHAVTLPMRLTGVRKSGWKLGLNLNTKWRIEE